MDIHRFRDPATGEIHRVRAASREAAEQWLMENVFSQPSPVSEPEPGISSFQRGLRDPLDAGAQMLERILPEQAVSGINRLNNWLVDMGVPLERLGEEGLGGQLANLEAQYQRGRTPGEFDLQRLLGNIVGAAAGGALAGPSIAASTPARLAGGTLAGFASGTLSEPVKPDEMDQFWAEKLRQGQWGAAGGAAGTLFGNMFSGLGARARRPEVEQMRAMGVEPTVGQTLGGAASRAEEKVMSQPFIGSSVRKARERSTEQYNLAVINDALEPLGARVDEIGHEGARQANRIVSQAYEDAAAKSRGVMLDEQALGEIARLRQELTGAPKKAERDFTRFFENDFERRLGGAAGFEPETFKKLDSDLGDRIRNTKGDLQQAFRKFQSILRVAAGRQDPEYRVATSAADAAFARMVRVNDAVQRGKLKEGVFTPGQLLEAAKRYDTRVRKMGVSEGTALMQPLANVGQSVVGNLEPDSGTAGRLLPVLGGGGLGYGAATMDPTVLAAILASVAGIGIGKLGANPLPQKVVNAALRGLPPRQFIMQPGVIGGMLGPEFENLALDQ